MRNTIFALLGFALSVAGFASCDNYNEEAPVRDETPSYYRLPDPQSLTDSDRAVINAMQEEYDRNGNN